MSAAFTNFSTAADKASLVFSISTPLLFLLWAYRLWSLNILYNVVQNSLFSLKDTIQIKRQPKQIIDAYVSHDYKLRHTWLIIILSYVPTCNTDARSVLQEIDKPHNESRALQPPNTFVVVTQLAAYSPSQLPTTFTNMLNQHTRACMRGFT